MKDMEFSPVDYGVFIGVLILSASVGLFYAIREKLERNSGTTENYLMGNRQLPLIPVALSLLVSFQSAILILGTSSEMYTRGTTYWWATVGISLSALLTTFVFVPVFYYLQFTSVYEYLEVRFGSKIVRRIGASLYILVTVIYLSIAMYAPSVALYAVSRVLPLWALILLAGCVCTFYVSIGGMKAVIWTDAIQAVFMIAGLIAVAVKGTIEVGGVNKVLLTSLNGGRLVYFNPSLSPFTYMTSIGIMLGQMISWLGWYGINQSAVQRYCGMKTVQEGKCALLLNIPGLFVVISIVCYCGLVMYAYFFYCDPLKAGIISQRDELLPYFVLVVLGSVPGIPGLFVACLYAGTLSTVSSGLNSLAAVVYEDFLRDRLRNWTESSREVFTKLLCLCFGVISTALCFVVPYLGGVLQAALSTMGALNGPLTGMFLLGVFVPWANTKSVILGAVTSACFCIWLCVGSMVTKPNSAYLPTNTSGCGDMFNMSAFLGTLPNFVPVQQELSGLDKMYSISYVLYDLIGVCIVFLVAVPVSYFTGFEKFEKLDSRLFHPIFRGLWKSRQQRVAEHADDTKPS